jgi:hypothetical protein
MIVDCGIGEGSEPGVTKGRANGDQFKYTGREYDAELDIYYYRARYTTRRRSGSSARTPRGSTRGM